MKNKIIFWSPFFCYLIFIPISPYLDHLTTFYFYNLSEKQFVQNPLFAFFYNYGNAPAHFIGILSFLFLFLSFISPFWKKFKPFFMVTFLSLVLGPGLIINGTLKEVWGRPRPKQTIEFGGKQIFRPIYKPNFFHSIEPSKSFPSGHASMGFYFFVFIFLGIYYKIYWLAYGGMLIGSIYGSFMGLMRIAQGGHYLSDVITSAMICFYLPWLLTHLLVKKNYEGINKTSVRSITIH
ncbi:MAG: hypothetical protein BGO10_10305 [Chlamydia sp. 32-24]|nr:MAG: hypothetical protein BGO10_10305 [Chlamydia sp. 32-24]